MKNKTLVFKVVRSSGLPMDLSPQEMDTIAEYEDLKAYETLNSYKDKLSNDPERMHSLMIEVHEIVELKLFLQAVEDHRENVIINFKDSLIEIQDEKVYLV